MTNTTELPEANFDLEKEFDEQVAPLIDALYSKLNELNMPGFIAVCYANSEGGEGNGMATSANIPARRSPIHIIASHFICEELVPAEIVEVALRTGFAKSQGKEVGVMIGRVEAKPLIN